jgi:hypothetical protein
MASNRLPLARARTVEASARSILTVSRAVFAPLDLDALVTVHPAPVKADTVARPIKPVAPVTRTNFLRASAGASARGTAARRKRPRLFKETKHRIHHGLALRLQHTQGTLPDCSGSLCIADHCTESMRVIRGAELAGPPQVLDRPSSGNILCGALLVCGRNYRDRRQPQVASLPHGSTAGTDTEVSVQYQFSHIGYLAVKARVRQGVTQRSNCFPLRIGQADYNIDFNIGPFQKPDRLHDLFGLVGGIASSKTNQDTVHRSVPIPEPLPRQREVRPEQHIFGTEQSDTVFRHQPPVARIQIPIVILIKQ